MEQSVTGGNQKYAIVTGASSGLGRHISKDLVLKGYYVIMACRNKVLSEAVASAIKRETGVLMKLVREFVKNYHSKKYPLHLLINNAGISRGLLPLELTTDGFESTFQTNHLGHYLLTNLLLEDLLRCSPSRIVIVSSRTHIPGTGAGPPPNFKWTRDEINDAYHFNAFVAYKNSKLANVWFCYELARRLQKCNARLTCNVVCPGLIPTTNLFRDSSYWTQFLMRWVLYWFPFSRSEYQAADALMYVATAPELEETSGKCFADKQEISSSEESYDVKKAKTLWELSDVWTQEKYC